MSKEDIMNKISFALKDPVLQMGFEVICSKLSRLEKENAELDCQVNRNKYCYSCVNATGRCFRNEIGCPCEKYKSYKDLNKQLLKANEWHKPSEKLPEECSLVLAYLFEETEPTICKYVVSNQWECLPKRIVFCSNDQVRKWKEITPPKEVKENEN